MKETLRAKELVFVASMLFGMFFGAGNLIFPVYMGQMAGSNVWQAIVGFVITGVGLPLLGILAMAILNGDDPNELASPMSPAFGSSF